VDGLPSNANRAVRVNESRDHPQHRGSEQRHLGIFTDYSDDLLLENNECFGSQGEHGIVSDSEDRPVIETTASTIAAGGIQINADPASLA
jgi:hypothetical protein